MRNVAIPSTLELPASLQAFSAVNDGYRESGAPVKALVESVPWPRLTALRSLRLQVGGSESLPPIEERGWHTYGSLWEAFDGRYRGSEYDALQAARRLLRRAAPALLRRMDFDPEADGTGIFAPRPPRSGPRARDPRDSLSVRGPGTGPRTVVETRDSRGRGSGAAACDAVIGDTGAN